MGIMIRYIGFFLLMMLASAQAEPGEAEKDAPQREEVQFRLEETGETRMCIFYSKLDGVSPVAKNTFLFSYEGEYYLNTTQSDCYYDPAKKIDISFNLKSPNLCRNAFMEIIAPGYDQWSYRRCTLSDFRKVRLVALD